MEGCDFPAVFGAVQEIQTGKGWARSPQRTLWHRGASIWCEHQPPLLPQQGGGPIFPFLPSIWLCVSFCWFSCAAACKFLYLNWTRYCAAWDCCQSRLAAARMNCQSWLWSNSMLLPSSLMSLLGLRHHDSINKDLTLDYLSSQALLQDAALVKTAFATSNWQMFMACWDRENILVGLFYFIDKMLSQP